jgi:NhaP-type Na+/H+ or K+/H+ antiporter
MAMVTKTRELNKGRVARAWANRPRYYIEASRPGLTHTELLRDFWNDCRPFLNVAIFLTILGCSLSQGYQSQGWRGIAWVVFVFVFVLVGSWLTYRGHKEGSWEKN